MEIRGKKKDGLIQKFKIHCAKQPQKDGRDSGRYLDDKEEKATSGSKARRIPQQINHLDIACQKW